MREQTDRKGYRRFAWATAASLIAGGLTVLALLVGVRANAGQEGANGSGRESVSAARITRVQIDRVVSPALESAGRASIMRLHIQG